VLRPIAENTFAESQFEECLFAEKNINRRSFLPKCLFEEMFICGNVYLPKFVLFLWRELGVEKLIT
jgi:hypothetical protein